MHKEKEKNIVTWGNIKNLIESGFLIDDAETGKYVPFKFNQVQEKYFEDLKSDYGIPKNVREVILKARKEGFTSLILAIFAAHCILSDDSVRFLEISYKDDATKQHFRRFKTFLLSSVTHNRSEWPKLEKQIFQSVLEGSEIVLRGNGASFYVGTANTRTGERGGTVQGILFSECAHYGDTGIIKASEIIDGTSSMVAVGSGMIFQETTANGFNHFKKIWDSIGRNELNYKRRFFSWKDFYTQEQ